MSFGNGTDLKITFTQKASLEDSVEFSFSAVLTDLGSLEDDQSHEEHVTAVCLSIDKAVSAAVLSRLRQTVASQLLESDGLALDCSCCKCGDKDTTDK